VDLAVLTLGFVAALLVFTSAGGIRGYDRSPGQVLGSFVGTAMIALPVLVLAWVRGPGSSRRVLLGIAVFTPIALMAWSVGFAALYPDALRWWDSKPGFRCMRLSAGVGSAVLLASLFARRRVDPVDARAMGTALGAGSGAFAWMVVDLWCPVENPLHLLIGHVIPVLFLMALGAWLGGRTLGRPDREIP
jgi:hypothetical protein